MKAVVLTRGRIATVDDKDFDRVNQFKWYAHKVGRCYYGAHHTPRKNGSRAVEYLHNFILGKKGVDHRDGDGLENRRQNLRAASTRQNNQGHKRKRAGASSRYRGVDWHIKNQKWRSRIRLNDKQILLGHFADEGGAARAYDAAAREYFGEFASPNFP